MDTHIPFFNFSLKKVLAQQPDTLKKARIKILYTILLLSMLKIVIILPMVYHSIQDRQLYRIIFVLVYYMGLTKYLLYKPLNINIISQGMILIGIAGIWSNIFLFQQNINLVTIQFVFMVTFVSYYLIDSRYAVIYSILAISPVMYFLAVTNRQNWHLAVVPEELPSPGFEAVVFMNFITMLLVHYLFYCAFRDNVNEKEALNKQLEATVAETKALADSRSVFLSTMSHELRTPLNAVIGMTNLVKDTATEEQTENLDILEFSAMSLLTLVNDILDYNKTENDKIELEAIPVNLPDLLHKVCTGLQQKAREKGLDVVLHVDENLKGKWIVTDPTRITQIIYNLVGNAIKFTEKGSVSVQATALGQTEDNMQVHFSVSDTGIGIAPNRLDAIFDPFTQASADTTRHYGGTGLGLAIVKRLLKLFNSEIHLQSKQGEGSSFSFDMDFGLYKGVVNPVSILPAMGSSLEGLSILIAEDNPINSLLLVKLLTKWNATSVVAANGQDAVDKLLAGSFDAILMDLHMPIMDGYQATTAVRALADPVKARIPIIALTASVSHNINGKINLAGMNDYLSKPFQPASLYQKLAPLNMDKAGNAMAG
ncbi:response regulator [Mucilaginibacter sp. ZT4R22]|uniref:histidine kinase n=1 Tax=Mucilaginibacter pankratovii TaxID=2772110 RepID=A0ABR7WLS6_9SPHI|nr:ATP-binding protein [Mucilaginibacter pankratovii]MBD1363284.1 response regulator [Mucilaginibacter pankratovii]